MTILASLIVSLNSAYAQWSHLNLKSRQDASITLDYTTLSYGYYGTRVTHMPELWIHVSRYDLDPTDQIRVILINHPYYQPEWVQVKTYDLKFAGDNRFSLGTNYMDMSIFNAHQELAVVINGEWQKMNSDSDNSNFEFRLIPYIPK